MDVRGEAIGVLITEDKGDHLSVYSIAIKPEHQHRGYAKALLQFADRHAATQGSQILRLHTNRRMTKNRLQGLVEKHDGQPLYLLEVCDKNRH